MALRLELSFRNLERSDFVESNIKQRCKRLESLSHEITFCHVVVSSPHQHQNKGHHYEVHVELRVPGTVLAATKNTGTSEAHEDLYVALRDAFEALERQLTRWKEKRRLDVKQHSRPAQPDIPDEI